MNPAIKAIVASIRDHAAEDAGGFGFAAYSTQVESQKKSLQTIKQLSQAALHLIDADEVEVPSAKGGKVDG